MSDIDGFIDDNTEETVEEFLPPQLPRNKGKRGKDIPWHILRTSSSTSEYNDSAIAKEIKELSSARISRETEHSLKVPFTVV